MYIKNAKLEKLMKAARKAGTLVIGCDDISKNYGGYYVAGSFWICHVKEDEATPEFLALIVKFSGRIPAAGEEYTIHTGMKETAIYGARDFYLPGRFVKATVEAIKTGVTVETELGATLAVYQEPKRLLVYAVNKDVADVIDFKQLSENEDTPEIHLTHGDKAICYGNETCYLEVWRMDINDMPEDCPAKKVLEAIEGTQVF